jgi:hypothetical protein
MLKKVSHGTSLEDQLVCFLVGDNLGNIALPFQDRELPQQGVLSCEESRDLGEMSAQQH